MLFVIFDEYHANIFMYDLAILRTTTYDPKKTYNRTREGPFVRSAFVKRHSRRSRIPCCMDPIPPFRSRPRTARTSKVSWTVALAAIGVAISFHGCDDHFYPDQNLFAPLDTLADSDEAVVRIYTAPVPIFGLIDVHTWFVVKRAEARQFDRWESWVVVIPPTGFIIRNREEPEGDLLGTGGVRVLAEIRGPEATAVIDFIETRAWEYPCVEIYEPVGPNSNTWTQWVLDQVGWQVELPPRAVGKDAHCPTAED